jgi:hypothetical protein
MAMRNACPAALATPGTASRAGQLGVGAAFVNEEQPLNLKVTLSLKPGLAGGFYIRALLLTGMGGLFLTV